jgi:uroporphyrinogen decarboxylase
MELLDYFESLGRTGAAPILGYPGARALGLSAMECLLNPELHAKVARHNVEKFGPDVALPLLDLTVEAEAFGAKPIFEGAEAPSIGATPSLEEAAEAPVLEPPRARSMVEAARTMSERIKGVPNGFFVTGPFTVAGQVIGIENLLKGAFKGEQKVLKLLDSCTEVVTGYSKALDAAGVDFLVMADPSSSLISPALFEKLSKPRILKIRSAVSSGVVLHICGRSGHLVKQMAETGVAGISLDENVKLADALASVPSSFLVFGNYSPTNLLFETPLQIASNVRMMLEQVKGSKNVVGSTGCDMPPSTPSENIEAFVRAVKSFRI